MKLAWGSGMGMVMGSLDAGVVDHPVFGLCRYRAEALGYEPDSQVARTIGIMSQRVREDAANPEFIAWARQVAGISDATPSPTDADIIAACYSHVKDSISFTRDENTAVGASNYDPASVVEVIIRPIDTMRFIQQGKAMGDCDDFSSYLAGLLTVAGIPCSFVTVAANGGVPEQYSHVYVAAYGVGADADANTYAARTRTPLDASHGDYAGWEVPNTYGKRKEWPITTTGSGCDLVMWAGVAALVAWGVGKFL